MKFLDTNFTFESATVTTASSQDPNFPVSNLASYFRSRVWRSTGCTSEWVVWDFATAEPIDTVTLFWSKENGPKLTTAAVITIQASATNSWVSPAFSQVLTINNTYGIASAYFATPQNYRYWRLVIADPSNPYGYVELGVAWLGSSIAIPNAQNGFKYTLTSLTVTQTTPFGHVYADEYPVQDLLAVLWSYLDYPSQQVIESSFRKCGYSKPVLASLDPFAAVFDKDHFCVYGLFTSPFGSTQNIYNILTTDSVTIQGLP